MEDLLLLHGFGGTHRAYDRVIAALPAERYRPLAPDLPGHGGDGAPAPSDLASCVGWLAGLAPARFALCGYSLGGRIALLLALAQPARVTRLVLVSSTAGIEDRDERAARASADAALADRVAREPLAQFAERWRDQPLFAGEPRAVRGAAIEDTLRSTPDGLAAALRALGAGSMAPVWDRLGELRMPVTVLAGAHDRRYVELGRRLAARLPAARLEVVAGAGHGLLREAPGAVAAAL